MIGKLREGVIASRRIDSFAIEGVSNFSLYHENHANVCLDLTSILWKLIIWLQSLNHQLVLLS